MGKPYNIEHLGKGLVYQKQRSYLRVNKETGEVLGYILGCYSIDRDSKEKVFVADKTASKEKMDKFVNGSFIEFENLLLTVNSPNAKNRVWIEADNFIVGKFEDKS